MAKARHSPCPASRYIRDRQAVARVPLGGTVEASMQPTSLSEREAF